MSVANKRLPALALVALIALVGAALVQNACTPPSPSTRAFRVQARNQLIGGPRALGEVGDFMLENDQIRVVIQDEGFSRGFGVFGGNVIDADLVRPGTGTGDSSGGVGRDNFGEMFPTFFLEALAPSDVIDPTTPSDGTNRLPAIEVTSDGRDGVAEITVRGYGGDFLAITQTINEALLGDPRDAPTLLFETRYRLEPGKRYIEMQTTVQNVAIPERPLNLPQEFAGFEVPTPFGDVLLFGAGNEVFVPHEAGHDLRFRLEKLYKEGNFELPALPGLDAEFIASAGDDVSYGLVAAPPEDPERNYVYSNRDPFFPDATSHSLHVPFIASAFTGVFQVVPPSVLAANDRAPGGEDEYTFSRYFIVGDGDVASISDVVYDLLGEETGAVQGRLLDELSGEPVAGAAIFVLDAEGRHKVTRIHTDNNGRFSARLRPGNYSVVIHASGRALSEPRPLEVRTGLEKFLNLTLADPATVTVTVTEAGVGRVPAKVSLLGTYGANQAGRDPKSFLFDLSLGETYRYTDFEPDTDDAATRRFIEAWDYTSDGAVTITARPGTYTVVASRGPEYSLSMTEVTLTPGTQQTAELVIERVVNTDGYIAADFHLHSGFSLDSAEPLDERIRSYAGEGVEFAVSTDHNFVVDYQPTIANLAMERFIGSAVGLELTTIDRGHFNGFPLRVGDGSLRSDPDEAGAYANNIASRTFGSFQWAERTPQEIMDELRALAPRDPGCLAADPSDPSTCNTVEKVIVQVNHPRDSILGYFDQYGVDQETLRVEGQSGIIAANTDVHPEFDPEVFSWDFDAIEIFNGKRYEFLRNYRVPDDLPVNPTFNAPIEQESCCPLTPGSIYRERPSFDCDEEARDCSVCTNADIQAQIDNNRCEPGDILFPGVVDDWFELLKAGQRMVGTANSDSHSPHAGEPGYPRTYVRVPTDTPRMVAPADIVQGFLAGDVLMTNGPFVLTRVTSGGASAEMGGTVTVGDSATIEVEIRHAPWVKVDTVTAYFNGEPVGTESVSPSDDGVITVELSLAAARDGYVVVEVSGDSNMFPGVAPSEIPPQQFSDVLDAVGGSFGLGSGDTLSPNLIYAVAPYALSNPIWIDRDGDGEITPVTELPPTARTVATVGTQATPGAATVAAPPVADGRTAQERYYDQLPERKRRWLERRLPRYLWPTDHPKDSRRVLMQFLRHNH